MRPAASAAKPSARMRALATGPIAARRDGGPIEGTKAKPSCARNYALWPLFSPPCSIRLSTTDQSTSLFRKLSR